MTDASNVFSGSTVFHGEDTLVDEFTGLGSEKVDTEDFIGGLIGDDLEETVGLVVALGAGVGGDGEFTNPAGVHKINYYRRIVNRLRVCPGALV